MDAKRQKLAGALAVIAMAGLVGSVAQTTNPVVLLPAGGSSLPVNGARIEFDSTVMNFGRASARQVIKHTFVFTNTGDQTLEISDVRPTCGCTVAGTWDRRLEPGQSGGIPIQYTVDSRQGEIFKTVIVVCNDLSQTNVTLKITGDVWQPVEVKPAQIVFGACEDNTTNQTRVVRIVNNLEQPLSLSGLECASRSFEAVLKTVQPGKEFELQVTLVPPFKAGTIMSSIQLKTSSTNQPVITIPAMAVVLPVLTAAPAKIQLPTELRNGMETKVIIQNNGSQPQVLSEPEANIAGVKAELRELQPGRRYELVAGFPAGFQIHPDQPLRIRVKTSDPKTPVFYVPVYQSRHLAAALNSQEHRPLAHEP